MTALPDRSGHLIHPARLRLSQLALSNGLQGCFRVGGGRPAYPERMPHLARAARSRRGITAGLLVATVGVAAMVAGRSSDTPHTALGLAPSSTAAPSPAGAAEPVPAAAPAPPGLPVIDYRSAPRGFPADPAPRSTAAVTEGLHPTRPLIVYDAPGGEPRALLPPSISNRPLTVPIVRKRTGWVAVLLPSVNRRTGWLTTRGWSARHLRDHLVIRRRTHELIWLRDGIRRASWTVTTGAPATPTPLGRTFVLGRTATSGSVYAGLDALALGSVPDDRRSLPAGLRGAHTGIHSWRHNSAFGRSISNGCIRVPPAGLRVLLHNIAAGSTVTVLD
jgi:hypothetical protein